MARVSKSNFQKKLEKTRKKNESLVCVGLDPVLSRIPAHLKGDVHVFLREIIDATLDLASCYKMNKAFYEDLEELDRDTFGDLFFDTAHYIFEQNVDMPVIFDGKRNDIGNTCLHYLPSPSNYYNPLGFTANPYMGKPEVFLEAADMTTFLLVRTSNPEAAKTQNVELADGRMYWEEVARLVSEWNQTNGNCGAVVGATCPEDIPLARKIIGKSVPMLIPGVGSQGGGVEGAVKGGGKNILINSSRGLLYASNGEDFAEAAAAKADDLRDEINCYL